MGGCVPAGTATVNLVSSEHEDESVVGVPTPRPMKIVAGGPAAVSVTSTSPACATVNDLKSLPIGSTVPLNVSVLRTTGGVGDVVVELPPLLSQATDSATQTRTAVKDCRMRHLSCEPSGRRAHGQRPLERGDAEDLRRRDVSGPGSRHVCAVRERVPRDHRELKI